MSTFSILTVCTANICRSPTMEILLRQRLDPSRFTVASAGVFGWDDAPVDGMVVLELARLGASAEGFSSRSIDEDMVREADLVLTATRDHRAYLLDRLPDALRRTFTLREFAALVSDVDASSPRDLVEHAYRHRSAAQDDPDLDDPYRQPPAVHRAVVDQIREAVEVIADRLTAAAVVTM